MMALLSFIRDAALVLAMAACWLLASETTAAATTSSDEPSSRWEPGHRSTASLEGEVSRDPDGGSADGVYGRFDGDLALAAGAGAEFEGTAGRLLLGATVHYYWMAGVYGTYRDALDSSPGGLSARRVGSFGVDVRPLFIPRWSYGWQSGPATLDLLLDSISLSAGAYFASVPDGEQASRRGFEVGLGAGLPLMGQASGPWLSARYAWRYPEAGDATGSVWLLLSWHVFVDTPLASVTGAVH